ncbi:dihydrodipicolinate synthase family protein [Priestia megaterium]|uniref:Dihydrodipicolinate synthase family protein n=1 Tax=Priestia megaterium TaxID=1404 RepID=A0A6H1NYR8_PRIMG|nr:dihydrodipicolinate synthase family protein [Priestia megaterium]QIZ06464.1 dihydrodipicolinate synthase family protein [Priestia megaterium]
MKPQFHGIIPPVPTIFENTGKIDCNGMKQLIDYLIDSGVHGLFFLGTLGEFSQMSIEERKELAAFATDYVNGRLPVLIGTGSPNTREVISLTQHSKEIGADGVVIINPYYSTLTEEILYRHYGSIAESVDIPIILYNFPALTGQDLTPDMVLKLAKSYHNIVGIKDTIDSAGHIREIILKVKAERPDFSVFAGYDDHLWNTLSLGGDGAIPGSGNFAPELSVGIYQAFQLKEYQKGIELHQRLAHLPYIYKLDSPFSNVIKEAIHMRGLNISTYVMPSAKPLDNDKKEKLRNILNNASLLEAEEKLLN